MPKAKPKVVVKYNRAGAIVHVKVNGRKLTHYPSSNRRIYHLPKKNGKPPSFILKVWDKARQPEGENWEGNALLQNRNEIRIWKAVRGTRDEQHFAPLIAWSPRGNWVMMKWVRGRGPSTLENPKLHSLQKKYKFDSECQYRAKGKSFVIYDYGYYDKCPTRQLGYDEMG